MSSQEKDTENGKRKKKKKRRKKIDESRNIESVKVDEESSEPVDEIERTVREVNKLLGEPKASTSKEEDVSVLTRSNKEIILTVQRKFLNPHNELKRICSGKTMQAEQRYLEIRKNISTIMISFLIIN